MCISDSYDILREGSGAPSFEEGCSCVRQRLSFVKVEAMGVIYQIFSRVYKAANPNDASMKDAVSVSKLLRVRQ
eukprot:1143120-Pyramimonas_sp.AAC.1